MTIRGQKRLLLLLNLALAGGLAATVALALAMPLDEPPSAGTAGKTPSTAPATIQKLRPRSDYAVIYQKSLRPPLYDAAASAAPTPQLNLKLIGTMLEPDFTRGLFVTASGEQKLVAVGESVDGAEVLAVKDGSATVKYAGQEIVLKVQKKEEGP